jgi:DNA invertase Pin-like site-specific DNA recombinase
MRILDNLKTVDEILLEMEQDDKREKRRKSGRRLTAEQRLAIVYLAGDIYPNQLSLRAIARVIGCTLHTVQRWARAAA